MQILCTIPKFVARLRLRQADIMSISVVTVVAVTDSRTLSRSRCSQSRLLTAVAALMLASPQRVLCTIINHIMQSRCVGCALEFFPTRTHGAEPLPASGNVCFRLLGQASTPVPFYDELLGHITTATPTTTFSSESGVLWCSVSVCFVCTAPAAFRTLLKSYCCSGAGTNTKYWRSRAHSMQLYATQHDA